MVLFNKSLRKRAGFIWSHVRLSFRRVRLLRLINLPLFEEIWLPINLFCHFLATLSSVGISLLSLWAKLIHILHDNSLVKIIATFIVFLSTHQRLVMISMHLSLCHISQTCLTNTYLNLATFIIFIFWLFKCTLNSVSVPILINNIFIQAIFIRNKWIWIFFSLNCVQLFNGSF